MALVKLSLAGKRQFVSLVRVLYTRASNESWDESQPVSNWDILLCDQSQLNEQNRLNRDLRMTSCRASLRARELEINTSSTLRVVGRSRDPLICLATVHDPTDYVRFRRDYHILSHIMAGFLTTTAAWDCRTADISMGRLKMLSTPFASRLVQFEVQATNSQADVSQQNGARRRELHSFCANQSDHHSECWGPNCRKGPRTNSSWDSDAVVSLSENIAHGGGNLLVLPF